MNKFIKALVLGVGLVSVSALSQAEDVAKVYEEGKNYTVVAETATDKPEVREFFSFYCGHCASFERFIKMVKPSIDKGVFKRNHVNFLGGIPQSAQENLTEAIALALTIENEKQQVAVIDGIFDRIHKDRKRTEVYERVGVREVFKEQGVAHEWFDANIDSVEVKMHAKEMLDIQNKMTTIGAIEGVPTVIVNGKYRIENSGLDRKEMVNDYLSLIDYLLTNP